MLGSMMLNDKQGSVGDSTGPRIFLIRKERVMLDEDLAALYEVETAVLCSVVARSIDRFPENAVFQLNEAEVAELKTQLANPGRESPYVFTGDGLALLSTMLLEEREAGEGADACAPTCSCRS